MPTHYFHFAKGVFLLFLLTGCKTPSKNSHLSATSSGSPSYDEYRKIFQGKSNRTVRNLMWHLVESEEILGEVRWSCTSDSNRVFEMSSNFKKYENLESKTSLYSVNWDGSIELKLVEIGGELVGASYRGETVEPEKLIELNRWSFSQIGIDPLQLAKTDSVAEFRYVLNLKAMIIERSTRVSNGKTVQDSDAVASTIGGFYVSEYNLCTRSL